MNNVVSNSQGGASRGRGTARGILFCCFCLIFFRAFANEGDRASSRGLVLRLGLRHHRSDPSVGPVVSLHRSGDTAVPSEGRRRSAAACEEGPSGCSDESPGTVTSRVSQEAIEGYRVRECNDT